MASDLHTHMHRPRSHVISHSLTHWTRVSGGLTDKGVIAVSLNSFTRLADRLHEIARPIEGSVDDFQPLVDQIPATDARFVLIGEASHGTHEFYRYRAQLTKRLIRDHGFAAVIVEADWPDAWRVNRYVRGFADDDDATDALAAFKRFPQWMWRNADVLDFVGWLRDFNDSKD